MRLQGFFNDIATFCPLATNLVENSHAQHQASLFTFRGKTKAPAAASECSILSSLVQEHAHLKSLVLEQTMPSRFRVANMQKQLGRQNGKQPSMGRKCRVIHSTRKKRRRISPWNVFQRHRLQAMSSGGSLEKEEFKKAMKQIGREWATMTPEDRSQYQVDAAYEQSCREELAQRALAPGPNKANQPENQADARAAKDQPTHVLEAISGDSGSVQMYSHSVTAM